MTNILVLYMIHAIIYDLDGTIVFSEPVGIEALKLALKELNIEVDVLNFETLIYQPINDVLRVLFDKDEETIREVKILWFTHYVKLAFEQGKLKLAPGIKETLEELKRQGYLIALGTGSFYGLADMTLEHFNIKEYFDVIVTIDEVTHPKPDLETFQLIAKYLNVSPEECIVIGDTKYDIIAAKYFGCLSVLYDVPITPQEIKEDEAIKPDFRIYHHNELLTVLKAIT